MSPLALLLMVAVTFYAVLALWLGWGLGLDFLVRHGVTQTAMVPATALAFKLSAAGLLAASADYRRIAQVLAAGVVLIFVLTSLSQMSGAHHFSALLMMELAETERMAPVTALGFLAVVIAVSRLLRGDLMVVNGIGIAGLSAFFALALMKFGSANGFSDVVIFSGVSLQTSLLFCLMFMAMCMTSSAQSHVPRR